MNRHQTAVAAEAFAAGVFAQAGYSVFVQYGANQPGYDLMVSNDESTLQVSVKGSNNGGWILAAKEKGKSWQDALDAWIAKNKSFVFCLVQFHKVSAGAMPNMYLATGSEIGIELSHHWFGKEMSSSLYENYVPTKGKYKGETTSLPMEWRMNEQRIREVVESNAIPSRK